VGDAQIIRLIYLIFQRGYWIDIVKQTNQLYQLTRRLVLGAKPRLRNRLWLNVNIFLGNQSHLRCTRPGTRAFICEVTYCAEGEL
jgi:hypothetical protein